MNTQWLNIILNRFLKMFLIGGLGSVLIALASNPLTDIVEWRSWGAILVTAFLTGGLAAIEKWTQGYQPR